MDDKLLFWGNAAVRFRMVFLSDEYVFRVFQYTVLLLWSLRSKSSLEDFGALRIFSVVFCTICLRMLGNRVLNRGRGSESSWESGILSAASCSGGLERTSSNGIAFVVVCISQL